MVAYRPLAAAAIYMPALPEWCSWVSLADNWAAFLRDGADVRMCKV